MPFVKITENNMPKRLVLSVTGGPKVGKTHFALSAGLKESGDRPQVSYINIDMGVYEVLPKFLAEGIDISVADHNMTEDSSVAEYQKLMRAMHADYLFALKNTAEGGTVIVDTASQVWQVAQVIYLDDPLEKRRAAMVRKNQDPSEAQLYPFDYRAANVFYAGLLRRAMQQYRVNVIFVHRTSEIYNERGQPTGVMKFQGFGETPFIVQMSVMLRSRKLSQAEADIAGQNFEVISRIESCRFDKGLEGLDIANPTFEGLLSTVL